MSDFKKQNKKQTVKPVYLLAARDYLIPVMTQN